LNYYPYVKVREKERDAHNKGREGRGIRQNILGARLFNKNISYLLII
jgi:hypothetical protein